MDVSKFMLAFFSETRGVKGLKYSVLESKLNQNPLRKKNEVVGRGSLSEVEHVCRYFGYLIGYFSYVYKKG